MTPPFSAVVPLYNKEKLVGRCLASILNQTHAAAEIIIVNDGSTDNSLAVVQKITDPRIVIFDQKNGGVSSARNFGVSRAKHELVALLDADDEWNPDFLEKMAACIMKFPDAGLYYAAHLVPVREDKVRSTSIPTLPSGFSGYIDIFKFDIDQGPWSSAVVIRKSLLELTGGFDPKLVKGEDIDMWIRFALKRPVVVYNTPLSVCHQDDEHSAMRKPCAPDRSLINNLEHYAAAASNNASFREYLMQMRLAHICNFLVGNPCELPDPHREIDRLDLNGLPLIWTLIRHSPRFLRRAVFRVKLYGGVMVGRLRKIS